MQTKQLPIILNAAWQDFHADQDIDRKKNNIFRINFEHYYKKSFFQINEILSPQEIKRSRYFLKEHDTRRFISTRLAIRKIISRYTGAVPQSVIFNQEANKKPSSMGVEFNISHSGHYILIAMSENPIGIDIEHVDHPVDVAQLIPYCFDTVEEGFIASSVDEKESFFALWTRKEALLKATGEGLIDNLLEINCLENTLTRSSRPYRLLTMRIDADYIFTLATSEDLETVFWNFK
ncbi:4'-phosphopantetheinyl transferase family protein [Pedobacter psychrodurus]|nr:4'-phosphopantetheinyl transferase superfamily protein [Pedobacter psychrodurus]